MKPSDPASELAQLWESYRALEQEKARWEHEATALRAERTQLLTLQEGLESQLQEALLELAELKRQLFGERSDQLTPEEEAQMAEVAGDLQEEAAQEPPVSDQVLEDQAEEGSQNTDQPKDAPKGQRRRRRRHPLPEHLERQTVVIQPEKLAPCEHCGRPPEQIGEETSEELEYVPAKLVVRRTVRPKYACRRGCGGVRIASLPPRLVPQSKLGLGLAVHLLLSRFDDHVAYYTLERNFRERFGVAISRQQMVQWVEKVAHLLQAIYRLIWEELKADDYLQIDESPVKVLDPEVKGKAAQGYLWFYSRPGGYVFLEFHQSRGRDAPRERLRGFQGTMQTDGYDLYDALRKEQPRQLKRIGCVSHARRKFYKALQESCSEGLWFIGQMRQLYRLEHELKDASPEERRRGRLRKAPAIWLAMKRRAEGLRADPRVLPQSTLGKAVRYLLNEYTALVGYLRDGRFEIDSNLVENDVRPSAVGKKRWLFIGHPDAGWCSAVIYTMIQSCRRYGINPQEYLTDVLHRLPAMTTSQVPELLPHRWKPSQR